MSYRRRFEELIDELKRCSAVRLSEASLGPPTEPGELARWRGVAGAAWPSGMSELYTELSSVDVAYTIDGGGSGAIHIPRLSGVWDHDALEDDLWFDWLEADHPFHRLRPIDRFADEACAVLFPVPADREASVAYHYCGETLVPTGLSYRAWLELLFRSRGVAYWLDLSLGPSTGRRTWIEEGIENMAALFPDFRPSSMRPSMPRTCVDV